MLRGMPPGIPDITDVKWQICTLCARDIRVRRHKKIRHNRLKMLRQSKNLAVPLQKRRLNRVGELTKVEITQSPNLKATQSPKHPLLLLLLSDHTRNRKSSSDGSGSYRWIKEKEKMVKAQRHLSLKCKRKQVTQDPRI
ncbi:hypothetical protein C0J45_4096 [Silurus meridionalis]|nr:hypothetical protein C0J45_4096 [Silurus meridionalis]